MPEITYPSVLSPLPGYLAVPEGPGPWPGVVIVQDVLGITSDLKQITDRFATAGYLALAPALYGRGLKVKCMLSTIRAHFADTGAAYDDLVAARDHLIADARCTGKIGLVGFCMGAGFCLQLAPRQMFAATAANYGLAPKDIDKLTRSCPVVASYGAKDRIVRRGAAAALDAVLARGGVARDVKEYPNVGHGFMNHYRLPGPLRIVENLAGMAYSAPEAEDAWRRIMEFFGEHLS